MIRERETFEDLIRGEKIVELEGAVRQPMAKLEFTKMHGCGNDYVYVVALTGASGRSGALAMRVADRRFGIGGDGLIMLAPSTHRRRADGDVQRRRQPRRHVRQRNPLRRAACL